MGIAWKKSVWVGFLLLFFNFISIQTHTNIVYKWIMNNYIDQKPTSNRFTINARIKITFFNLFLRWQTNCILNDWKTLCDVSTAIIIIITVKLKHFDLNFIFQIQKNTKRKWTTIHFSIGRFSRLFWMPKTISRRSDLLRMRC